MSALRRVIYDVQATQTGWISYFLDPLVLSLSLHGEIVDLGQMALSRTMESSAFLAIQPHHKGDATVPAIALLEAYVKNKCVGQDSNVVLCS